MSAALYDAVARIARHEAGARMHVALARVTDTHAAPGAPPDHAVTVVLLNSGLVCPRVPIAVGALGFAAIPAPGDLVVLAFVDGDVNAPVMLGRLYHAELDPPDHADGQLVLRLPPGAAEPVVDLTADPEARSVVLKLPREVTATFADEKITLVAGEMSMTVDAGGRVDVAAGGSTIVLKQDGDVSIESAGDLTLKGRQVSIEGQARLKIGGKIVEIN